MVFLVNFFILFLICIAGVFETEIEAAQAYDLYSINRWGDSVVTNFPVCTFPT